MRSAASIVGTALLLAPLAAHAFPFGGQTSTVVPCYNQAIFATVGPPRGGNYIWTPATKTYQFGPPSYAGQWLLGLASAPYFCVVSIEPVIVWAGTAIDMMGSSGGGSIGGLLRGPTPVTPAPPPISGYTPPTTIGAGGSTNPTTIGHVVVSEVFSNVDAAHGAQLNQWAELYNGLAASVDVSGWTLKNVSSQTTIPAGTTLLPGQFLLLIASSQTTSSYWSVPTTARIVVVGAPLGALNSTSDSLTLSNASGTVDSVSWGSDTTAFSPSAPAAPRGSSLSRKNLTQDTNTANDWAITSSPTPGK